MIHCFRGYSVLSVRRRWPLSRRVLPPQSGGLLVAAMVAAGAFPYRTQRPSIGRAGGLATRRAGHLKAKRKVSGRSGRIAAAGINAAICGEPPGSIRSCKSPAAITAK